MTTTWSASASLSLNTIVAPTSGNNGLFFKVTQAGTTGSSEPSWPIAIGETVYDNNVRYVSFSSTFSDLQSINPSAIIELFTLQLDNALHGATTIYRFHAGSSMNANGKIIWDGNEYFRFPIQATGFSFQQGKLPRPKLAVSNGGNQGSSLTGLSISAILLSVNETTAGNDLTGATVTRIRTLAKFLDAANFEASATTTTTTVDSSDIETVTFTVTVVQDSYSNNVFAINGTANASITMKRGSTYIFNQSHSSNVGHPLRIKSDSGGQQTTTNTGTLGTDATVTYQPAFPSAPTDIRYYCTTHGNAMGNSIDIIDPSTTSTTSGGTQTNPFGTPDPKAEFPREIYTIDRKSGENREVVEFELASVLDLAGVFCPKRQCTRAEFPAIGTFA